MMPGWLRRKHPPARSLNAQISMAERQLSRRRQTVGERTTSLRGNIHKQMTAPATLLLASSIGFIAGELSHCPARRTPSSSPAEPSQANANSRLRTLLSLLLSARTLYHALPMAWLRKRFVTARPRPTNARRHHPVAETSYPSDIDN